MNVRSCFHWAIVAVLLFGITAFSQQGRGGNTRSNTGNMGGVAPQSNDDMMQKIEIHAALQRNADRQRSMVQDAQQLLKLANELNEQANKGDDPNLSADMIKRIDEIEKLAKHVREKMKGDY